MYFSPEYISTSSSAVAGMICYPSADGNTAAGLHFYQPVISREVFPTSYTGLMHSLALLLLPCLAAPAVTAIQHNLSKQQGQGSAQFSAMGAFAAFCSSSRSPGDVAMTAGLYQFLFPI